MTNARQILEEFTASSFRDPNKAAEMFAENGAFEMPYLNSIGFPSRRAAVAQVRAWVDSCRT
jgi:hypothetical protein